jgi:hypothetical protein
MKISTKEFYVYEHLRNDNGAVFYVGKGKNNRASVDSCHHRSVYWQRIVKKAGGFNIHYVAKDMEECKAFGLEVERISQLRNLGVDLCNMTNGGDGLAGLIRTEDHRRKIGDAHRGKIIPEEVRDKISKSVKKSGFVHSPEMLEKMSNAHKGNRYMLGKKHTDEWREEQKKWTIGNKSRTGQKRSDSEKALQSKAMTGRKQSILICPECGKQGGNAMRRWHFENCRTKELSRCK